MYGLGWDAALGKWPIKDILGTPGGKLEYNLGFRWHKNVLIQSWGLLMEKKKQVTKQYILLDLFLVLQKDNCVMYYTYYILYYVYYIWFIIIYVYLYV